MAKKLTSPARTNRHQWFVQRTDGWRVAVCFRTHRGWQKPSKDRTYHFPNRTQARDYVRRMRRCYDSESVRLTLTPPVQP